MTGRHVKSDTLRVRTSKAQTERRPPSRPRQPARPMSSHLSSRFRTPDDSAKRGLAGVTPTTAAQGHALSRVERTRALRRRQARLVTIICSGICAVIIATSFPAAQLFRQHSTLTAASTELDRLRAGNEELSREADDLSKKQNVADLARRDYDMVRSGQQGYDVLPSTGTKAVDGQSTLGQSPVAPGSSESQALIGDSNPARVKVSNGPTSPQTSTGSRTTSGLWGRVLDSLEFWR